MLIDELRERLKAAQPGLDTIITYWETAGLDEKYHSLQEKSNQPDFWQDPQQATTLKELQNVRLKRDEYLSITSTFKELDDLLSLFADDANEIQKLEPEINKLVRAIRIFKIELLLHEQDDDSNCFLSINAGAGGTESQDWAEILLRMYLRFCERYHFTVDVVDYQAGEGAGIKSATLFIKGKKAYGFLKGEHGIHRLVRISPFDANKRRHTSFAGVTILPEVPDVAVTIDPKELRIDTYRAGGAGGQHVNKTESAVRITHLPTNIVVQCQNERSQIQNRETAMKMLMAKLVQKQREEEATRNASYKKQKIEWGSQIRSYVLHPYKMVKDHRTDHESPQPDLVLDGDLMPFIEAYLIEQSAS